MGESVVHFIFGIIFGPVGGTTKQKESEYSKKYLPACFTNHGNHDSSTSLFDVHVTYELPEMWTKQNNGYKCYCVLFTKTAKVWSRKFQILNQSEWKRQKVCIELISVETWDFSFRELPFILWLKKDSDYIISERYDLPYHADKF